VMDDCSRIRRVTPALGRRLRAVAAHHLGWVAACKPATGWPTSSATVRDPGSTATASTIRVTFQDIRSAEIHRLRDGHRIPVHERPADYTSFMRRLGIRSSPRPATYLPVLHDPTSGFVASNRAALDVFSRSFPLEYPEIEAWSFSSGALSAFASARSRAPRRSGRARSLHQVTVLHRARSAGRVREYPEI